MQTIRRSLPTLTIVIGLCATPLSAWAADDLEYAGTDSILSAFEYFEPTAEEGQPVSYMSDCACEPSCEIPCESCDSGCGADVGCGDTCGCPSCKKKKAKPNPCATSHKGVYYANDFSYLKDPSYNGCCFGDCMKLRPVGRCGQCGTLDIGGQVRLRYHHEKGMAQEAGMTRFQDTENDFMLSRMRLYANWKVNSCVRFYVEGILADVASESDYIPRGIDRNYGDLLNAFVDLKLTDSLTARVGRQELLYGAQRTISPLDWANTRRTFEGAKLMYNCGDWSIDAFFTNFVPVDPDEFDEANYDQTFYGAYAVYSGMKNRTVDLYYIGYDDERARTAPATQPPASRDFSLHTFGARVYGTYCENILYEIEGAYQTGRQSDPISLGVDHEAGFATAGLGRKFPTVKWKPEVWVYYDYASGNHLGGDFNRYNQLFPLAHKYLGFIDATQRANIESPNLLLKLAPSKKLSFLLWYYHFMSNSDTDIVPAIGGTPAQSTASKDWGDELDVIVKYNFNPRSNILFGWSHFWAGNKITPAGGAVDADFVYTQWELNF